MLTHLALLNLASWVCFCKQMSYLNFFPCIFVIGEAALVADVITRLIFQHLEQSLPARKVSKAGFWPDIHPPAVRPESRDQSLRRPESHSNNCEIVKMLRKCIFV